MFVYAEGGILIKWRRVEFMGRSKDILNESSAKIVSEISRVIVVDRVGGNIDVFTNNREARCGGYMVSNSNFRDGCGQMAWKRISSLFSPK